MPETNNIADKIKNQLPAELVSFMLQAGETAAAAGNILCLVGGVVRNLLLGKSNLDIDLMVEGDAIALAQKLAVEAACNITIHKRFNTANIDWHGWSIDITSARLESYAHPGALPDVKPGSIEDDLLRRDFTINAMAADLSPQGFGRLIDLYNGQKDLEQGLIRVLHDKSFIDDSTRIWRGLRYEQRLDFRLESETLRLLERDIDRLDGISGDRIRYELECILAEKQPEKVLQRAAELGLMVKLNSALEGNGWLASVFSRARKISPPWKPPIVLYITLLTYNLTEEEKEQFISYLKLPKTMAQSLIDSSIVKSRLPKLASDQLKKSVIYHLLHGYNNNALKANLIAADSEVARHNIQLYMDKLCNIKPQLTGNDLLEMSIPEGPHIKQILNKLLDARLDREARTPKDEERLVKGLYPKIK
ncbi:CCA tRNA nucleotidyltransferase [Chloroflexota bacterium]